MFCQCGATVGYAGTDSLNLYPKKRSALPLILGMVAGALIFVLIITGVVSAVTKGRRTITDRTKWERVSGPSFSMTIPSGMKDKEIVTKSAEMMQLLQVYNSEAAIAVSAMPYDSKRLGSISRKKLEEMIKERMPAVDDNGHEVNIKDRGRLFYYDYAHEQSGVFYGADTLHVVDAMYVGKSHIYDIIVLCPEKKYADYEQYIFAWIDSFEGD